MSAAPVHFGINRAKESYARYPQANNHLNLLK